MPLDNSRQIPNLPSAIALSGAEEIEAVQAGTSVRLTVNAIITYYRSLPTTDYTLTPPLQRNGNTFYLSTVPVNLGGTGSTSFTSFGVLYGNSVEPLLSTSAGVTGQVLVGNTGAAPSWASISSSLLSSFSAGATGFDPSTPTSGAVVLSGVLNVGHGGTGNTLTATGGPGHVLKQELPGAIVVVEPLTVGEVSGLVDYIDDVVAGYLPLTGGTVNPGNLSVGTPPAAGVVLYPLGGIEIYGDWTTRGYLGLFNAAGTTNQKAWAIQPSVAAGNSLGIVSLSDVGLIQKQWEFKQDGSTVLPGPLIGTSAAFSSSPYALAIYGASGTNRTQIFATDILPRWNFMVSSEAESGGNAGSNFYISSFADDGSFIAQPFVINRATGLVSANFGIASTMMTLSGTIPPASNDTTVPTTAWVRANISGGVGVYLPLTGGTINPGNLNVGTPPAAGVVLYPLGGVEIYGDWTTRGYLGLFNAAGTPNQRGWAIQPSIAAIGGAAANSLGIVSLSDAGALQKVWAFQQDGNALFPGNIRVADPNVAGMRLESWGFMTIAGSGVGSSTIDLFRSDAAAGSRHWLMSNVVSTNNFSIAAVNDSFATLQAWNFNRDGSTTLPGGLTGTTATFNAPALGTTIGNTVTPLLLTTNSGNIEHLRTMYERIGAADWTGVRIKHQRVIDGNPQGYTFWEGGTVGLGWDAYPNALFVGSNGYVNFSNSLASIAPDGVITATSMNLYGPVFGALELGGPSGAYIDLKTPASDDYDLRLTVVAGVSALQAAAGTTLNLQADGVGNVVRVYTNGVERLAVDDAGVHAGGYYTRAGGTYGAGVMGFTDANFGMLFRAAVPGAISAFGVKSSDGLRDLLALTDAGAVAVTGPLTGTTATMSYVQVNGTDNVSGIVVFNTAAAKSFQIKPEVALNTTQLFYWTGAAFGTLDFPGPLIGTTATFSSSVNLTGAEDDQLRITNGAQSWHVNNSASGSFYLLDATNSKFPLSIFPNPTAGIQIGSNIALTGPLNGTSATFNGNVILGETTGRPTAVVRGGDSAVADGALLAFRNGATDNMYIGNVSGVFGGAYSPNMGIITQTGVSLMFALGLTQTHTFGTNGSLVVTGPLTALSGTAVAAGANTQAFVKASSTANLGIYYGTGAPTFTAAKGSFYSNTTATTTTTRLYVNTDGGTTWANLTTSA